MKTALIVSVLLCITMQLCAAPEQLPTEGLKRAQQAEKLLAADKPQEAIKLFNQIDRDFPGHASVSLRLAQIYDKLNDKGAALHYYRRYMRISGEKALEDASARVTALEYDPIARSGAQEFARKIGNAEAPIAVATPETKRSVAAMREDGSLETLRNEQDLERVVKETTPTQPVDAIEPDSEIMVPGTSPEPQFTPPPEPTAEALEVRKKGQDVLVGRDRPRRDSGLVKIEPSQKQTQTAAAPESADVPSLSNAPRTSPAKRTVPGKSVKTGFFEQSREEGEKAVIVINNAVAESLLTFKAVSQTTGQPSDAILRTGEDRRLSLEPGTYKFTISLKSSTYPPSTLLNRSFELQLKAGTLYSRTITSENLQTMD